MKAFVTALALVIATAASHDAIAASTPTTPSTPRSDLDLGDRGYAYPWVLRTLTGFGGVPDASSLFVTTLELGRRPFYGAFSAGISGSFALGLDPSKSNGQWLVGVVGIYLKLDLTYVFLTGLFTEPVPTCFPFRIQTGARVGIALSDSFGLDPSYVLGRFELAPFVDFELPLGRRRAHAIVLRGTLDTSVALTSVFRWSFALGWEFSWGK